MENPQSFLLSQSFTGWNQALQARGELVPASHTHLVQDCFLGCEHPVQCADILAQEHYFRREWGIFLCPCFTQGQKFGWHYAFSVSYDLFFVFSWLFLSEGRSLCAPFQTKSHCSPCSSISIPSSLLFTTWNTMVSMLWEGKLAANCSDGEKCAKIGALQKCTVPEAWFPMVLCLSYDWALIHAAALFSVGVRRGLLLSKCLYSLFVLVIEGLPACYLSGMLV